MEGPSALCPGEEMAVQFQPEGLLMSWRGHRAFVPEQAPVCLGVP